MSKSARALSDCLVAAWAFAAVIVRIHILGIEADRLIVIDEGLVELVPRGMRVSADEVPHRVLWIEADLRVEIGEGLVELVAPEIGVAAVSIRHRILGLEAIASSVTIECLFEPAAFPSRQSRDGGSRRNSGGGARRRLYNNGRPPGIAPVSLS